MVGRARDGAARAFPVVETLHRDSILLVAEAPAAVTEAVRQRAREVAERAAACLEGVRWLRRRPKRRCSTSAGGVRQRSRALLACARCSPDAGTPHDASLQPASACDAGQGC